MPAPKTNEVGEFNDLVGKLLAISIVVFSAPAAFQAVISWLPHSFERWLPNVPLIFRPLAAFIALMWFTTLLLGRLLFLGAFVLELFLVFRRGLSVWWKLAPSILLALALRGILLIESQARSVRH